MSGPILFIVLLLAFVLLDNKAHHYAVNAAPVGGPPNDPRNQLVAPHGLSNSSSSTSESSYTSPPSDSVKSIERSSKVQGASAATSPPKLNSSPSPSTQQTASVKRPRGRPRGSRNLPKSWSKCYLSEDGKRTAMGKLMKEYQLHNDAHMVSIACGDPNEANARALKLQQIGGRFLDTICAPVADASHPSGTGLEEHFESLTPGQKLSFRRVLSNNRCAQRRKAELASGGAAVVSSPSLPSINPSTFPPPS